MKHTGNELKISKAVWCVPEGSLDYFLSFGMFGIVNHKKLSLNPITSNWRLKLQIFSWMFDASNQFQYLSQNFHNFFNLLFPLALLHSTVTRENEWKLEYNLRALKIV